MATKTAVNTNMPSTRGISILIDQNQTQQQKEEKQQQQQQTTYAIDCQQETLRSSQKADGNGNITIYHKTIPTTTTTTATKLAPTPSPAITRTIVTKLQPQPVKLVEKTKTLKTAAATTTTRINVNDDVNSYKSNNDNKYNENAKYEQQKHCGEFVNEQKTGYITNKQTIKTKTTNAVPIMPQFLLNVVASERGEKNDNDQSAAIHNNNEEMHITKTNEDRALFVVGQDDNGNNNNSTQSNSFDLSNKAHIKSVALNGQIQQNGMMIIQCNGYNEHHYYNNNELSNNFAHHKHINNNEEHNANGHHANVGSLVINATTTSTPTPTSTPTTTSSNVDHDESSYSSRHSCMTSVVGNANGQNAFDRFCTKNDQNGSKYDSRYHQEETKARLTTADYQQQLKSKDVNANTNVHAIVANSNFNLPIAKNNTVITAKADYTSAVTETDEVQRQQRNVVQNNNSVIIWEENEKNSKLETNPKKLHVLKIQIKQQIEEEVNETKEKKQITIVNVSQLKEQNLIEVEKQQQSLNSKQTIPVRITETNQTEKSATNRASESVNYLKTINDKMVQKPAKAMSLTATPTVVATLTSTATASILNSGAVNVTAGNSNGTKLSKANANVNGCGNANGKANGNGNGHDNANSHGTANGNANINGNCKANNNCQTNTNGNPPFTTGANTTVTEVNVTSHPSSSYLYYVMSSGQFSPCDTLDSGTGSDLESNGNITPGAPSTQNKLQTTLEKLKAATDGQTVTQNGTTNGFVEGRAPTKMELLLKGTKIRLNGSAGGGGEVKNLAFDASNNLSKKLHTSKKKTTNGGEHLRTGSFTDSEESEASSLSCDSLHSNEFMRQSSVSPTTPKSTGNAVTASRIKLLGSFLPDSLLRDIRDRKFPTNDFEAKYGNGDGTSDVTCADSSAVSVDDASDGDAEADEGQDQPHDDHLPETINEHDYVNVEHTKILQERNNNNNNNNNTKNSINNKRLSLPNKTFTLNAENGTFVDTKMNSMPRKYEADKYYNFHVKEHENFRSYDFGCGNDLESFSEYETKSLQDDAFAGYKDICCGSATSTIRSSKGTVRGVKNRVRNGIATFLQLQQPNGKNFKEKDAGKVVLYTTSMGIIRDTYAKCANVKQILRTLLVKFEERDVFMSIEYQQEIKERMHSEAIKVPQLFVEGQHIGDADTVERLNESGELRQLLKPYKSISTTFTCQTCGGYRLLPCPSCNGSKKSVHRNHFTAEFVALKCMNCDEVGLVKCHSC